MKILERNEREIKWKVLEKKNIGEKEREFIEADRKREKQRIVGRNKKRRREENYRKIENTLRRENLI